MPNNTEYRELNWRHMAVERSILVDGQYELHMLLSTENCESIEEMTVCIGNIEYIE